MIGEELVCLAFLYIKLFELGVEVAFYNRSTATRKKINLLKFSLLSSCSERTNTCVCKCVK